MAGRWRLEPDEAAEAGAAAAEALLDAPLLQRLARRAADSMDILETDDVLEVVQVTNLLAVMPSRTVARRIALPYLLQGYKHVALVKETILLFRQLLVQLHAGLLM